jgi:ABC-type multidrug transport system fused ATPase/permease subunit
MSAYGSLKRLLGWLPARRQRQILILLAGSLVGATTEFAIFGALIPFLTVLADPSSLPALEAGGFAGRALDALAELTGTRSPIVPLGALLITLVLVATAFRLVLIWATTKFSEMLGHELSVRLYRTTLHRPYAFHVSKNTSEIIAGVQKAQMLVSGVLTPALDFVVATALALGIIGALLWVDWIVAISAALLFGTIYLTVSRISRRRVLRNSRIRALMANERIRALQEGLGGIRDTILDASQALHVRRFSDYDRDFRAPEIENKLWGQVPRYVVEALGMGVIIVLTLLVSSRSGGVGAALPVLGAVALGAQRLLPLFQRIYQAWSATMASRGNIEDVIALIEGSDEPSPTALARPEDLPFTRELRLEGLGFRYAPEAPWVFRDFDLTIARGARIGFAGQTGCGKSTLLDVVMGLLTPVEGQMSVDEVRITRDNVQAWRAHIAHVPQAIFLADASIAENIAFGIPPHQVDRERLEDAARRARIHDFITGLDHGYDTEVGERGVRLSGGQRQRIGIARALYRRADVLVLDEATSALDDETEASVMEGIEAVGSDVTVLIVAHRLSTLDNCDRVIRMDANLRARAAAS